MISQSLSLVMPAYVLNDHRHTIAGNLDSQPDTLCSHINYSSRVDQHDFSGPLESLKRLSGCCTQHASCRVTHERHKPSSWLQLSSLAHSQTERQGGTAPRNLSLCCITEAL